MRIVVKREEVSQGSSWLLAAMYTSSTVGFALVSVLPTYLGLPSRMTTVPFHALELLLGLLLTVYWIIGGRYKSREALPLFLYLAMWGLMLYAVYNYIIVRKLFLASQASEYYLYVLGITLIPSIAFFAVPNIRTLVSARKMSLLLGIIAVAVTAYVAARTGMDMEVATGRLEAGPLSPISVGHLGLTVAILGLDRFVGTSLVRQRFWDFVRWIGILLGIGLTATSGGRSSVVALAVCLVVLVFTQRNAKRLVVTVAATAGIVVLALGIMFYVESTTDLRPLSRFDELKNVEKSQSAGERKILMHDAWQQFLQNPVTGNALVETNSNTYPHNFIVEAFMATGVFGGMLMIAIFTLSGWSAVRLLRAGSGYRWIGLLCIQNMVLGMFSGTIFATPGFWRWAVATMVIAALSPPAKPVAHSDSPRDDTLAGCIPH